MASIIRFDEPCQLSVSTSAPPQREQSIIGCSSGAALGTGEQSIS